VSSSQKLASLTFQVPFSSTATPFAFGNAAVLPRYTVYVTVACLDEVSWTADTLAEADEPRADMPLIVLAKAVPFCSRVTRWAFGVDPLKNFSQLDLMVAVVALEAPVPPAALAVGAAEVAAADGLAAGALELGLLEQAVIAAAASTKPSAGAARARRTSRWNRIRRASLGRGTDYHVSRVSNL
jgi:hypothetical protein